MQEGKRLGEWNKRRCSCEGKEGAWHQEGNMLLKHCSISVIRSFFLLYPSPHISPFSLPPFSLSRSLALCVSTPPPPRTLICPLISTAALAPLFLYLIPPIPPSSPFLLLSLSPSLLFLSAVQHSDYHSSHRVRPDSQILLSTLLHHLLLEGAMESERLRQREEEKGRGEGKRERRSVNCRMRGMKEERGNERGESGEWGNKGWRRAEKHGKGGKKQKHG